MSDLKDKPVSTRKRTTLESLRNHIVRCDLRKLIILNSIILIVCSIALSARFVTNATSPHDNQKHHERVVFEFEMIVMIISLTNALFGLTLAIYERRKHLNHRLMDRLVNFNRFNFVHLILNITGALFFSFVFILEFIRWCGDLLSDDRVRNRTRLMIVSCILAVGLCQTACAIGNRALAWSPKYRYSRLILLVSSTILIMVSIASIMFNTRVCHLQSDVQAKSSTPLWYYRAFQATSSCTLLCGLAAVALALFCGRKTAQLNQLHRLFNIFCVISLMIVAILAVTLWPYHTKFVDRTRLPNVYMLARSNPLLSGVQCTLLLFSMASLYSLVRRTRFGRNGLSVERIRLSQAPTALVAHWATAIDTFNPMPCEMTGDAALQLMKAYENGQLKNVECLVLRVCRSCQRTLMLNNQWDDTEALVFLTVIHKYDVTEAPEFDGYWGTIFRRVAHSIKTTTHYYPFVLRLGLLGYQWPFRTGIFFTTSHPHPLTRTTHVLETIIDWNEMQEKGTLHCDVLLLPTASTEPIAKAIPLAGFFPMPLPPTHLLDLRPHHGKTWEEYMETLKKDNRRRYIERFLASGGTIEEVHDFSPNEVGEILCRQWENIARRRRENKEPPTLAKPSTVFISSMGNTMNKEYRSILFLRFNNEVIASAVIYRFPHKLMTIDLPGLAHEKARPLKAYFVMLQWTVREALEKKYDFIDFGSTTPGPKMDLGCVSVPLAAGGYADNPVLAFGIQQAGSNTDDAHRIKDDQQPSTAHERQREQDESKLDTRSAITEHDLTHQTPHKKPKHVKQMKKTVKVNSSSTNVTNVPRIDQSMSTSAMISMLLQTSTTELSVPQLLPLNS